MNAVRFRYLNGSLAAAAMFSVLTAAAAGAQAVATEQQHGRAEALQTFPSPCTKEPVTVETKSQVRVKQQASQNGSTRLTTQIHQQGRGIGALSLRDYNYMSNETTDLRSSTPVTTFRIRTRGHLVCQGQCPLYPAKDDFFVNTTFQCADATANGDCVMTSMQPADCK